MHKARSTCYYFSMDYGHAHDSSTDFGQVKIRAIVCVTLCVLELSCSYQVSFSLSEGSS